MKGTSSRSSGRSGRPPKFREPRRPVTITLPERTLRLLAAVDRDRARAVVRVTDATVASADGPESRLVEVVEILPGIGIILVGASRYLRQIPWLRLVELAPGRLLLSIPSGTPVESLEIAVHDLLETVSTEDPRERAILEGLHALIRTLRRGRSLSKAISKAFSKAEMLFVDMRSQAETEPPTAAEARGLPAEERGMRNRSPQLRRDERRGLR
jgi:hypothetical protein